MKNVGIIVLSILLYCPTVFSQFNFFHMLLPKIKCNGLQHANNGICEPNIVSCPISNGSGTKTWNGASYGSCIVNSCNSGYSIYNGACALTGIQIVSATWGTNCANPPHGNLTDALGSFCNSKSSCIFRLNNLYSGDPYPGCAKQFGTIFKCTGVDKSYYYTLTEAGGRDHIISCP